ncbi:MAG TPA: alkaline phosphatase family protein [Spirochaetia bacterium]
MSTKPFSRVLWIVLDGMGWEHARRCIDTGLFPSLQRMSAEGHVGPSLPSSPECQTPSALLTLFTGAEPPESGVWGYYMPDPRQRERSISGFAARPRDGVSTLWSELGARGMGSSLMNVAFRNDPVWREGARGLDFGYDGYRGWRRPRTFTIGRRTTSITFEGLALRAVPVTDGIALWKGSTEKARLVPGVSRIVQFTPGVRAYALLLDRTLLVLAPLSRPMVRGAVLRETRSDFFELDVFRVVRRTNTDRSEEEAIPVSVEMTPIVDAMRDREALMLEAIRETSSRLVIGYFPLIDELNHVYADQLETDWPNGRGSELLRQCVTLVDGLLGRVMAEAGPDTLVAVSSDHGSATHRSILHLNELLAVEGLVRRAGRGYDYRTSTAFYHPSDCGLVMLRPGADRTAARVALQRALGRAHAELGVGIAMVEPQGEDGALAFLYPLGDAYFVASPPGHGRASREWGRAGGHHLSPLSPTPWIKAVLGLWSPGGGVADRVGWLPTENRQMKRFLREALGVE